MKKQSNEICGRVTEILADGLRVCVEPKNHPGDCAGKLPKPGTFVLTEDGVLVGGGGGKFTASDELVPIEERVAYMPVGFGGGGGGPVQAALDNLSPRDAFEGGFEAGYATGFFVARTDDDCDTDPKKETELAWESFKDQLIKDAK